VILEVNDAWRRFGDDNGFILESVGQNYLDVCQTADAESDENQRIADGIRDVINGRRTHFAMQYPCHSPQQQRWFVIRVTRFSIPGPVRVVVAHDDVTHRVLAEEAVAQSNRRKDEFLAMLGHELRNPLAGIVTSAQVLSMLPPDDPDCEKMQAVIQRQAGHMVRMVDDLLDVSRIARGKLTLQRSRLDLVQLVQQSLDDYLQSHPDDALAAEVELPQQPLWISGDATRLQQVLTNLIHNACKFSERPCRVRVRLTGDADAGLAALSIRDFGIGMTRETLARVFEPFNQAQNTIDRTRGGIGMGLALVRGLIKLHDGRVTARSEGLGKGSEFQIELPLDQGAGQSESTPASEEPPPGKRRVLLIDDTKDALFPLERMLSKSGMEVATALDGPNGLEEARRFRPDVILCDIGLPGMDGYAVAAAVREDPMIHEVYLVAVTGYGQEEDRRMAQEAGFDYHLTKPVSKASLDHVMTCFPRFDEQPLAAR
jgi:signal transduction histidine kinase/ActR/RegA family two-component response regulator